MTSLSATSDEIAVEITLGKVIHLVLVVIAIAACAMVASRLDVVIGLTLAAAVVAVLTAPLQHRLQRSLGHIGAVGVTAFVVLLLGATVGLLALRDLSTQTDAVAELLRERLAALRPGSFLDRMATSLRLESGVGDWLDRVPSLVVIGADEGAAIGMQVAQLVFVVILSAFFQSSASSLRDRFVALWPRDERVGVREFLAEVDRRGVGYVRRSLVLGAAAGVVVATTTGICGVPGAVLLGIWTGAWFVVPAVGWVVGLAPVVAVVSLDGSTQAIIALGVAVITAAGTVVVRRHFVEARTMRLGVAAYVLGIAIGVSVGDMMGSVITLVAVAAAGAGLASSQVPSRFPAWSVREGRTVRIGPLSIPLGWRGAVLAIVAAVTGELLWMFLSRLGSAFLWLLIGAMAAVTLSRAVAWAQRRLHLGRSSAISAVLGIIVAVLALVVLSGASEGVRATQSVSDRLPAVVSDLESAPLVGGWLRDHDAARWVSEQLDSLPQRLRSARDSAAWLPTIGTRLLDLFWTALVAVALLIDGPRLLAAASRRVPARHRRQFTRLVEVGGLALSGYAGGAALIAALNGGVVLLIAVALGIGPALVLAVWAFVWNFIPQVGGLMGGVPLVLFALIAGPSELVIATVLFLLYQVIDAYLVQPAVIGTAIDIPAWAILLTAIAGAAAGGVVGAVVLTPLVGVIRIVAVEYRRDDFPGATMRHDPVPVEQAVA